jgi:hypothetical protein
MGNVSAQCVMDSRSKCADCTADEAIEVVLDDIHADEGDDKNSQALLNHKLLKASREGDVAGIQLCLRRGAFTETRRPFVMTPESTATIKAAAQHRGVGFTPLMYVAEAGYLEACEVLLDAGACVNAEDEDGMTPLHFAACAGSGECCVALLRMGADPMAEDDEGRLAKDLLPPKSCTTQAEKNYWDGVFATECKLSLEDINNKGVVLQKEDTNE